MTDRLHILAENRENILLAETGAMIHNIGKVDEDFLINHKFDYHLYYGDWLYDLINTNKSNKLDRKDIDNINNAHNKFYSQSLKLLLSNLKISFQTPPLNDRVYELREYSSLRKRNLYDKSLLDNLLGGNTSLLGKLLSEAHGLAVGGDKGFTIDHRFSRN